MAKAVKIRMPGKQGIPADFLVDGVQVGGITAFTLTGQANGATSLVLELAVRPVEFDGRADVFVSDRAWETLIRFGWTPPTDA